MKFSIRWKLMLSYLLLTVVIAGTLYIYLSANLERYMVAEAKEALQSETRLAKVLVLQDPRNLHRSAPAIASSIKGATRARVTIIDADGQVIGDSDVVAAELKELENHALRPEFIDAVKTGEGQAIRYSATLQTPMLYNALWVQSPGTKGAVLRLALPLSAFQKAKANLHAMVAAALTLAVILSILLSYVLSNVFSRSLRAIASVAARIGRGDFSRQITLRENNEIGALAAVMNDMAERIREQLSSLAAERNRLDAIIRGMGEGLLVTNAQGIITLSNPAFQEMLSIDYPVLNRPLIDVTRHPGLHQAMDSVLESGKERLEEIVLQLKEERYLLTHWVPLLEQGVLQGVVVVFHDITDLKKLERIRKDFVANVSHELRTPVTVIKGCAESMLGGLVREAPEQAEKFIGMIHNHSERLSTLISDLLALAELESRASRIEMKPVSLDLLFKKAYLLLEQKAQQKGVTIRLDRLADVPPVLGESGKLEQVFVNLLDNGIKYTPEGGSIAVTASQEGEMVKVTVADSGIGIPANDLPRIFERFYRVDAARSRELGGTGLGLAIVKHIVQLHGGRVEVESLPGKGSTFAVFLIKAGPGL